jgi:hypothetical protein
MVQDYISFVDPSWASEEIEVLIPIESEATSYFDIIKNIIIWLFNL